MSTLMVSNSEHCEGLQPYRAFNPRSECSIRWTLMPRSKSYTKHPLLEQIQSVKSFTPGSKNVTVPLVYVHRL